MVHFAMAAGPVLETHDEGHSLAEQPRGDRAQARARQAAKRRTFPLINSQIIAAAETGDLELFMSTAEAYLPQMNLVNVSTTLHRLARLPKVDQEALRGHPVTEELMSTLRSLVMQACTGGAPPQCQALSNIVWSLATVQILDALALRRIAELAAAHMTEFKPFELSSLLWGFARLCEVEPAGRSSCSLLFERAVVHVAQKMEEFTFRCLVMLVWAFAEMGHHDPSLFRAMSPNLSKMMRVASCSEVATIVHAYGVAGARQDKLFSDVAQKAASRLSGFEPRELVDLAVGFARNSFFHRGFLDSAALSAARVDMTPSELCLFLCAAAHTRPQHATTCAVLLALLPKCTAAVDELSPDELASLALTVALAYQRMPKKVKAAAAALADAETPGRGEPPDAAPAEAALFLHAAAASLLRRPAAAVPAAALGVLLAVLAAAAAQEAAVGGAAAVAGASAESFAPLAAEWCQRVIDEVSGRVSALEPLVLAVFLHTLASLPLGSVSEVDAIRNTLASLLDEVALRSDSLSRPHWQQLYRTVAALAGIAEEAPQGVQAKAALADACRQVASPTLALPRFGSVDLSICVGATELLASLQRVPSQQRPDGSPGRVLAAARGLASPTQVIPVMPGIVVKTSSRGTCLAGGVGSVVQAPFTVGLVTSS